MILVQDKNLDIFMHVPNGKYCKDCNCNTFKEGYSGPICSAFLNYIELKQDKKGNVLRCKKCVSNSVKKFIIQ